METRHSRIRLALFAITGIFTLSMFLMMAALKPAESFILLRSVVLVASFLAFILLPVVLLGTLWWGVSSRRVEKMEAWWWLSAPFSVTFPTSMATFHMGEFGHALAPFIILFYIAFLSSTAWMLATTYQLTISRTTNLNSKNGAMMLVVVLAGFLLFTLAR